MSNNDAINVTKDQIEAFNDKNWDKWLSLTADNCVYDEVATQNKIEGSEKIVEIMKAWKEAFPNVKGVINHATTDGKHATLQVTWIGKHTGPLQTPNGNIPPTGKEIQIRGCYIGEIENGKVKKFDNYFDMMTMMTQLGLAN